MRPETQELEARIIPLIGAGIAGLSGLSSLFRGRDLEFEAREYEPETQDLEAQILPALPPGITAGLAGLSSITALIPNFVNRPKREPSLEPQGFPLSRLRPLEFVTTHPRF